MKMMRIVVRNRLVLWGLATVQVTGFSDSYTVGTLYFVTCPTFHFADK
jgi:hypothetical protein